MIISPLSTALLSSTTTSLVTAVHTGNSAAITALSVRVGRFRAWPPPNFRRLPVSGLGLRFLPEAGSQIAVKENLAWAFVPAR